MVVALDQQPRLVPDAEREGPHRPRHPLAAQPGLGRGEQGARGLRVGGLEHPPLAEPRPHMLEHQAVDLRRDPPDDRPRLPAPAGRAGEEQGRLGMLEPGVLARRDQPRTSVFSGGTQFGIARVEPIGEVDEGLAVGLRDAIWRTVMGAALMGASASGSSGAGRAGGGGGARFGPAGPAGAASAPSSPLRHRPGRPCRSASRTP